MPILRLNPTPRTTNRRKSNSRIIENALHSPTFQKIYSRKRLQQHREQNQCPVNDRLSAEGVWLPQYVFLGERRDMDDIADAIAKIYENRDQLAKL